MAHDYFKEFLIGNYILICIALIMVATAIQKYKENKRNSIYIMLIMAVTMTLAISETLSDVLQYEVKTVFGTTLLSCINYVLRPLCILLFIMLSGEETKTKKFYFLLAPIILDIIVYILPLIPGCKGLVFCFSVSQEGNIYFTPANTPLRYMSHIISAIYLVYLTYRSISFLRLKHFNQAVAILFCDALVIASAMIETFWNDNGDIHILNHTIAISVVFYYLYLYTEKAKYDTLTGLFARFMYYNDLRKMDKTITGVVQLDMNGLKYYNDTYGHDAGDLALRTISQIILRCCSKNMYPYRLGGDEFIILVVNESKEKIDAFINQIKEEIAKTEYHCALGYAYRNSKNLSVQDLTRLAEAKMYQNKNEFYQNHPCFKRRKIDNPLSPTDHTLQ